MGEIKKALEGVCENCQYFEDNCVYWLYYNGDEFKECSMGIAMQKIQELKKDN